MTDDQGVLGNLPRSRPGQRSEKRGSRSKPDAAGTAKTAAPSGGARPRSSARPKPAAGPRRAAGSAAGERQPTPAGGDRDPVRGAIRGVAGLAFTGAKVATGVTRELLRRVPRP